MSQSALPPDRSEIATEKAHPEAVRLDAMKTSDLVLFLAHDQQRAIVAVENIVEDLAVLVESVVGALLRGGRLIYLGAGTSGRLGVLDASECPPTFNSDPRQVIGLIAGGDDALRRSSEGAEDDHEGTEPEFERLAVGEDDVVVGIAAGGTTPWVLGGLELAHQRGASTALVTCAPRDRPPGCDQLIQIATGPEALTGSTRLAAGTATKVLLNTLTTSVFVRLGKIRGNLMIDLRATNEKLHDRCLRIMCELFPEIDRTEADRLLSAAGGRLRDTVEAYERSK